MQSAVTPGVSPTRVALIVSGLLNLILIVVLITRPSAVEESPGDEAEAVAEIGDPSVEEEGRAVAAVASVDTTVVPEPEPVVEAEPVAAEPTPLDPVSLEDGWRVIHASLRSSIPVTLSEAAAPDGDMVSATYARLFAWDMDLRRDLRPNDGLALIYRPNAEGLVDLAAATMESIRLGRTLTAYQFHATGDSYPSYWQEDGTEMPKRLQDSPLDDYEQVTSLLRDRPNHHGMDFMTPTGTPIRSPWDGVVTRTNWNWRNNGNCVEVSYPDGVLAKFLHLSENQVEEGDRVSAGQVIALTGNTGITTGPHLHYQLNRGREVLDPLEVHGTYRRTLPAGDMDAFRREVARLNTLLEEEDVIN